MQGELRFVMTVKGSRILLSVASAAEELKAVIAEAQDFSLLSVKVPFRCRPYARESCMQQTFYTCSPAVVMSFMNLSLYSIMSPLPEALHIKSCIASA